MIDATPQIDTIQTGGRIMLVPFVSYVDLSTGAIRRHPANGITSYVNLTSDVDLGAAVALAAAELEAARACAALGFAAALSGRAPTCGTRMLPGPLAAT